MTTESADESHELAVLQKIEEANRLLEADKKLVKKLSGASVPALCLVRKGSTSGHSRKGSTSGHSRKGSDTSSASVNSHASSQISVNEEDASNIPEDSWVVWGKIIADWDNISKKKSTTLRELVRKGIPQHLRAIVWQLLCGAHNSPAKEKYAEYLQRPSPCEKGIRRDIARTYPEHQFFKEKDGLGQESLFNVMKAYSLEDREVGYCQGSGFIVGLLLMQMPEEDAFAVLIKLMQDYRLRELFKPNMMELGLCMYQLESLIQESLPNLAMHFQSQGFHTSMYASSWFLTLYATTLPLSLACRVMDLYISEGLEVIFKIGMAILTDSEEILMGQDMEGMIRFFQNTVPTKYENDPESLFTTCFQVKYSARKMKKLEKEYTTLKTKENEEQVELRRLRTENRLLRQRIDNLEKETSTLADRLIHAQVTQAQEAEEMFAVRRELSGVKQRHSAVSRQLDDANDMICEISKVRTSSNASNSSSSTIDSTTEMTIRQLQEELTNSRLKNADHKSNMQDMMEKIKELENTNRRLQDEPAAEIAAIQEELIASKLREAEGNLSLRDLKQHVHELDQCWQQHLARIGKNGKEKNSKSAVQCLHEELMGVKIREAESLAELKESKQKLMELEAQNQICSHQIRRMDDENKAMKGKNEEGLERERSMKDMMKEYERKVTDLHSREKENAMMVRLKNAEFSQTIAEMRQRIAELEIENQELVTAGQLQHHRGGQQELMNKVVDLQDEVLRLKLKKNLTDPGEDHADSDSEQEDDVRHMMKAAKYYIPSDSSNSGSLNSLHRLELNTREPQPSANIHCGATKEDVANNVHDVVNSSVDVIRKFDNVANLKTGMIQNNNTEIAMVTQNATNAS